MEQANTPTLSKWAWLGIGALALIYAYVYYQRTLNGPFRFADDVAQHYLWLFGEYYDTPWRDGYYARTSGALQPWGYYGLLKLLGQFIDPLSISRYGVFAIALVTVGYGTALFRRFMPITVAVAGALLLFHYSLDICMGFLARGFMIPLLLVFGYYLVRGDRPWGVAGALVAGALFYPPAVVVNLTVLGLYQAGELLFWWRGYRMARASFGAPERRMPGEAEGARFPWRDWLIFGGAAAVSLLLIWLHSAGVKANPDLGGFLPRDVLLRSPEFSSSGRVAVTNSMNTDIGFFVRYFSDLYLPSAFAPHFARLLQLAALVLSLYHFRKMGRFAGWALGLTVATAVLFVFGQAVFPLLFLPDRFIVYPWRLVAVLVLVINAAGVYHLLPRPWLATLLVVLLLAYGHYNRAPAGFGFVGLDDPDKKEFYDAIRALPAEAVLAAPPVVASWIPVMTQRMPFISHETAHALYFTRYHEYVMPRFRDYATAVSTPGKDLAPVVAFLDKWDIDYLLVDTQMLRNRRHELWSPHKQIFESRKAQLGNEKFALLQVPEELGTWIGERYRLLAREELAGLTGNEE